MVLLQVQKKYSFDPDSSNPCGVLLWFDAYEPSDKDFWINDDYGLYDHRVIVYLAGTYFFTRVYFGAYDLLDVI